MEPSFIIDVDADDAGIPMLKTAFVESRPAQNDQVVRDAHARVQELVREGRLAGGRLLKITGKASLPVIAAITHDVGHLYDTLAVFDPKLAQYVVVLAHGSGYRPGDLIP